MGCWGREHFSTPQITSLGGFQLCLLPLVLTSVGHRGTQPQMGRVLRGGLPCQPAPRVRGRAEGLQSPVLLRGPQHPGLLGWYSSTRQGPGRPQAACAVAWAPAQFLNSSEHLGWPAAETEAADNQASWTRGFVPGA